MPQSQIEQESNCCLFFTLYIFIKFAAFKKTNNIRCKTISSSSGKRFLAPRILCWFHLFQPAGKWIESLTCSASKEALWVRTTVWFSLCDFRPWADILTEIKHMCRTYMSSTQGFNRWRWKKKMERGGVVSSKRVNYKKSWLSRRGGGGKQRKLKSWLGYCGERRVWSLGSCRDQTGQRWSFYSLKETFALSVTSGFFGLRLYLESGITNCLLHPVASDWVKFTARRNLS